MGADVGALDAAGGGRGGEAVLVGDLLVVAVEGVQADLVEGADVGPVVLGGDAMRVLGRVEEAHRGRVVARPLDVAAEIALVAGRQKSLPDHLGDARQHAAVGVAGVEGGPRRAVPVVDLAGVGSDEDAALTGALRDVAANATLGHPGAERARKAHRQRRAGGATLAGVAAITPPKASDP